LKAYCKRTVINENNKVRWSRDKYYKTMNPEDYEMENGVYMYVMMDQHQKMYYPLSKRDFDKYFINIDEIRSGKIDQILE
jgi:hypothetical protein